MNGLSSNLFWHTHSVTAEDRCKTYGYKSCVIWFTGLSAAGKSTIANALCKQLHKMKINSYVLDGDNVRHGLSKNLGFTIEDRKENIRRIGEVSKLFIDAGLIVMSAFISPFREDRDTVRSLMNGGEFIEVFVKCALTECEKRDPKGIYRKARTGMIKEFTGISSPYEEPLSPEIVLETDLINVDDCVETILTYLIEKEYIHPSKQVVK